MSGNEGLVTILGASLISLRHLVYHAFVSTIPAGESVCPYIFRYRCLHATCCSIFWKIKIVKTEAWSEYAVGAEVCGRCCF